MSTICGSRAALELDHDAHAFAAALVAHVGNIFDGLVVDEIGDAFDQLRLVHLIRNLGDDDRLFFLGDIFDGGTGAHHEASAASLIGIENSSFAVNDAVSRKVGPFDDLENVGELRVRVVDQRNGRVNDLCEIVRRNFCGHADGNSVGAIEQQIRNTRGQNVRLNFAAIVVGMEIDGFFVEVFEQRGGNLREFGFGVTIGCGRISIDRAEVSLPKNQRVAQAPGLCQPDEGVIHREVAVGMVLAHDIADDAGALAGGAVRLQPHLLHGVKNAAMHRLQSVAHIGERAADDDRHRIVEIRLAHLLFNVDGMNVAGGRNLSVASGRRSQGQFWILIVRHESQFSVLG